MSMMNMPAAFLWFGIGIMQTALCPCAIAPFDNSQRCVILTSAVMSCFLSHSCRRSAFFIKDTEREGILVRGFYPLIFTVTISFSS